MDFRVMGTWWLAAVMFATGQGEAATSSLAEARATLAKWVETSQLVSRTRSDWQAEKETLEQTVQLYERELKSIEDRIARVSTNSAQVVKERFEATALRDVSEASLNQAHRFAGGFEAQLRQLVPRLPVPLQDILKKDLLARIPNDPAATNVLVSSRVQTLVGILNEIDKFNNAVNVFSERRKNAQGEEAAVETVYVGLGAAYFVNDLGDLAGVGAPGSHGWDWAINPEVGAAVKEVIKIYRNERPARFVPVPVAIR